MKIKEIILEASYDGMVNNLKQTYPEQIQYIDNQVKTANDAFKNPNNTSWWIKRVEEVLNGSLQHSTLEQYYNTFLHYYYYEGELIQNALKVRFENKKPDAIETELRDIYNKHERKKQEEAANDAKKKIQSKPITPEPGDKPIITCDNGMVWWFLDRGFCPEEARSGDHCGNVAGKYNENQRILSLRNNGRVQLTFILDTTDQDATIGSLGEMKAVGNQKPHESLHPCIMKLLLSDYVAGIKGGGYLQDNNFSIFDLNNQNLQIIQDQKPNLITDQISVSPAQALKAPDFIRKQYYTEITNKTPGIENILNQDGTYNESEEAWEAAINKNNTLSLIVPDKLIPKFKDVIINALVDNPITLISTASRSIRRNFDILKDFISYHQDYTTGDEGKRIGYIQPTTPRYHELCKISVNAYPWSIKYIPTEYLDDELINIAWDKDYIISYFNMPSEFKTDDRIKYMLLNYDHDKFDYGYNDDDLDIGDIPPSFLNNEENIDLAMKYIHNIRLSDIPKKFRTVDVCVSFYLNKNGVNTNDIPKDIIDDVTEKYIKVDWNMLINGNIENVLLLPITIEQISKILSNTKDSTRKGWSIEELLNYYENFSPKLQQEVSNLLYSKYPEYSNMKYKRSYAETLLPPKKDMKVNPDDYEDEGIPMKRKDLREADELTRLKQLIEKII